MTARSVLAITIRLAAGVVFVSFGIGLLELAEACDVPVRWACRTGVCHTCETGLVSGDVSYRPDPLEHPASGDVLICCSRPRTDLVVDL
jgi:ferredoxin